MGVYIGVPVFWELPYVLWVDPFSQTASSSHHKGFERGTVVENQLPDRMWSACMKFLAEFCLNSAATLQQVYQASNLFAAMPVDVVAQLVESQAHGKECLEVITRHGSHLV